MDSDSDLLDVRRRLNELGQLASGVGHHVINAFSAVVSNAEILRVAGKAPNPPDPALLADMIIKAAVDASGVARRLIDCSRPATDIGTGFVALDELIVDFADEARAGLPRGVALEVRPGPAPPIQGDATQLRAMLGHLVANAVEAMPPGGGTITLATSAEDRGWAALEVVDDGRGMDARTLERAVEPFFSTRPGHLGVGLSIANGIWRRHRGTLALRSEPGGGTRVRLCVEPRTPAAPPAPRSRTGP